MSNMLGEAPARSAIGLRRFFAAFPELHHRPTVASTSYRGRRFRSAQSGAAAPQSRALRAFLLAVGLLPTLASANPREFLQTYCFECHNAEKQKGDRRFDTLAFPVADAAGVFEVQDIIDQLNLGDMPPKKAKKHPTDDERAAVVAALTESVAATREKLASTGAQTVLRRLNRREYLNTVSDLLALDLTAFDPTTKFPRDRELEHMDNIGDALVTSGHLLDQYLDAADVLIEKALGTTERPKKRTWRFKGNFHQGQELSYSHKRVYNYRYLCVYEVPNTTRHEGGYAAIEEFAEGVPADGFYEVKALAHALNRDHPYDPGIFQMDPDEPFRLGIVPGDHTAGPLHHPQPIEPKLAEVTVQDGGDPEWHTMKRLAGEGADASRFVFPNGMRQLPQAPSAANPPSSYQKPTGPSTSAGSPGSSRPGASCSSTGRCRISASTRSRSDGPNLRELAAREPEASSSAKAKASPRRTPAPSCYRFADRAYRRPATRRGDRPPHGSVVAELRRRKPVMAHRQAVLDAIKAVTLLARLPLSERSPRPSEADREREHELGPHDLAARLTYFLWATMPDAELRVARG